MLSISPSGHRLMRPVARALVTIQIFAAGISGTESLELKIGNHRIAVWNQVGAGAFERDFHAFEVQVPGPVNVNDVEVAFTNDAPGRDLRVDRIVIGGKEYQTEAAGTWSTGTWAWGDCVPGHYASEWLHCNGSFQYLTAVPGPGPIAGTAGAVRINHEWKTVIDPIPAERPVLLAGPATLNDQDAGSLRVRLVDSFGFDIRFSEWSSYDAWHAQETSGWMLLPSGRYVTSDGSIWEIGTFSSGSATGEWKQVNFEKPFPLAPYVFLTIQSDEQSRPLVARAKEINRRQLKAALFAEEAAGNPVLAGETVGYVAIYPAAQSGVVSLGPQTWPYYFETLFVSSTLKKSAAGYSIKASEEQTADPETTHAAERTRILRLGNLTFAQDMLFKDPDPFSYRIETMPSDFTLAEGFRIRQILPGSAFEDPVDLEIAPDGRIFVAEEGGKIWVVRNGARLSVPWLDLGDELFRSFADQGALSSIALDPGFASNGFVYALYTAEVDGQRFGRLSRFTHYLANPDRANPATQNVILGKTFADGFITDVFHNVGDLRFGTDGSLLVSWGDTAGNSDNHPSQMRSQQLDKAAGKIFRIDRTTGQGLPSNPFYTGNGNTWASRVFAIGLRNGFRFQIHPDGGSASSADGRPGTLYIGDVGRNQAEEINIARGGENFGWPYYEGILPYWTGGSILHTPPVSVFPHPENRCIIGGAFCQGTGWPETWRDTWLAADFLSGWIRAFQHNPEHTVLTPIDLASGVRGITAMAWDSAGSRVCFVGRGGDLLFSEDEGFSGLYAIEYDPDP